MSSNQLKIIACVTMLIDHIGYLLFPDLLILRYIGRIAMPIFSYFIAEGCRYTHSKIKYFLNIFSLATFCQLIYLLEALINGGISQIYLNILFTFSLSVLLCCSYLKLRKSFEQLSHHGLLLNLIGFAFALLLSFYCCTKPSLFGIPIELDYGIAGVFLPLFAVIFPDKERQLPVFCLGIIIYNLLLFKDLPYIWFSLFTVPLILLYNGTRGTYRLKAVFYIFYPLHFALLYGIKLLAF